MENHVRCIYLKKRMPDRFFASRELFSISHQAHRKKTDNSVIVEHLHENTRKRCEENK